MIKDLTPSVLDTDLFDLRKAFKVCKTKYSAIYPQNDFYVFLSDISIPKSEYLYLTPVYFDITDNVIRCGRDAGYLFRTEVGYASFNTEISQYENADIEYAELAKFEYEDKEVYHYLFSVLQQLNGICVPYLDINNTPKPVIDLSKHLDIGIGFLNLETNVTIYNALKVRDGGIIFNDVKMTIEEFTPVNVLRKLFRSFNYDVLVRQSSEIELKISSFKDTFNTLSISLTKPREQQSQVLTDGNLVPVVKARTITSYVSRLEIMIDSEQGADIFTSVLQWLLNIGRWVNSSDVVFSNGKEVIKSLFRCIRSLNVKEFLSTMFVSEETKDFGLSEKKTNNYLTLGVGGQVKEDGKSKVLMTVLLNRDTSVVPSVGSTLKIEDLNPQKFKDFVYKVFNKL